jgi:hypothetical protein
VSKSNQRAAKPLVISLLAMLAMMAVWFALSSHFHHAMAWFALFAAADIALLERWTRNSSHITPRWIAPLATVICCLLSLWLITALSVSYSGGFSLNDSAKQMGMGLFNLLLSLRLNSMDWLFLAISPILAYFLADAGDQ